MIQLWEDRPQKYFQTKKSKFQGNSMFQVIKSVEELED